MESRFDGTVIELFGVNLAVSLLTFFTLGIGYPWALVMKHNYIADHTLIDGRRVRFDGTGGQLFGIWLKISLLTIITLGIYYFWAELEVQRWVAQQTHLEGAYAAAPPIRQQASAPAPAPLPQEYAPLPATATAAPVEMLQDPAWPLAPAFVPRAEAVPEPAAVVPAVDACTACGARLPENARFCQKCGSPTA